MDETICKKLNCSIRDMECCRKVQAMGCPEYLAAREVNPISGGKTFNEACHRIANEIAGIVISKQADYGHGNIMAFGEHGILVRASDKLERLKNIHKGVGFPKNETIDDTWIDLAGYSIVALMVRNGVFTLPLEGDK